MKRHVAIAVGFVLLSVVPIRAQTTNGGGTFIGGGNGGTSSGSGSGASRGIGGSGGSGFGPTGGLTLGTTGIGVPNIAGRPGGATGNTYPTASNPFRTTYANPFGIGTTAATNNTAPKAAFGQPLFGTVTSTNTGALDAAVAATTGSTGFSTIGIRKAPPYVTTLADDFPRPVHSPTLLEQHLRDVLQRSSSLTSRNSITVAVDGSTVLLRGSAVNLRERRLAESLVRLAPGVRDVKNEIEVP